VGGDLGTDKMRIFTQTFGRVKGKFSLVVAKNFLPDIEIIGNDNVLFT